MRPNHCAGSQLRHSNGTETVAVTGSPNVTSVIEAGETASVAPVTEVLAK